MKRPGYYVEGKYFAARAAQAEAFAQFRATEFGRNVDVTLVEFNGSSKVSATKQPEAQQQVA